MSKRIVKPSQASPAEEPAEEWEADGDGFFSDFGSMAMDGPSKRKAARNLARFEERHGGVSLEKMAMDPVLSAAEARRKIAETVRARAGLAPKKEGAEGESGSGGAAAGSSSSAPVPRTLKEKVNAKFARKEARKEEAAANRKKFKKVESQKKRIESAKKILQSRKGRR